MKWYVYILECNDGSYYTGIARNLKERVKRHNTGRGAVYTKKRKPVVLRFVEEYSMRREAKYREENIKKLGVNGKRELIRWGDRERFPSLLA
ncbi:MAG: hypothetical protein A3C36_06815 [Omnitrophica WOR_2 bacterium RIFCSPHIGHO2_02_FULL_52_10]|nr:MAG: hypothetical protein A3C36_06815 [Omnitrophica WOR_2 bacterium RIFCSPHIGHO2_02_FULL_52_10]